MPASVAPPPRSKSRSAVPGVDSPPTSTRRPEEPLEPGRFVSAAEAGACRGAGIATSDPDPCGLWEQQEAVLLQDLVAGLERKVVTLTACDEALQRVNGITVQHLRAKCMIEVALVKHWRLKCGLSGACPRLDAEEQQVRRALRAGPSVVVEIREGAAAAGVECLAGPYLRSARTTSGACTAGCQSRVHLMVGCPCACTTGTAATDKASRGGGSATPQEASKSGHGVPRGR